MDSKTQKRISKFLSLILRHRPELIQLKLEPGGWVAVSLLLEKMAEHREGISLENLQLVVRKNSKQRFSFNLDGTKIRANQGHSVNIDLQLSAQSPPEFLYHGTAQSSLGSILKNGLDKRQRHHVHLSADTTTARQVGQRHGKAIVLKVLAQEMYQHGFDFYKSDNGVWLSDRIPPTYLVPLIEAMNGRISHVNRTSED